MVAMAEAKGIAVVTGATSGIGAAIARELATLDYAVMLAGRDEVRGAALRAELEDRGARVSAWYGDLGAPAAAEALMAATVSVFGGLDLLVNNAGIIHYANAEETTDRQWRETMTVNLDAVFYLSRAAVPLLRERGGGAIVNIASDWGLVGGKRAVAYCASKGAVIQLTRAMALDHAGENIRINAVCPGDTDTPMMDVEAADLGLDPAAARREAAAASPTGRMTTPEEVAKLVAYLASDAARQITGAAIPIDAGNTAG